MMKKLRKSQNLVLFCGSDDKTLLCHDIVSSQTSEAPVGVLEYLHEYSDWKSVGQPEEENLQPLVDFGLLIEEASKKAEFEKTLAEKWTWGMAAAMFHFGLEAREFLPQDQHEVKQIEKKEHTPSPPLYCTPTSDAIALPEHSISPTLLDVMKNRRSERDHDAHAIGLGAISSMLKTGLGISGFTKNCVGDLPLKMTPSGGARNPYEAYVFVRNVDGLDSGIYHYYAINHSLGRIGSMDGISFKTLFAGQDWANNMSCIIVFCAHLERTMWKYDDPNAYRVVLIEAGHIAQNMMLAATDQGMTACPTGALDTVAIREACGIEDILVSPIYALGVNKLPV